MNFDLFLEKYHKHMFAAFVVVCLSIFTTQVMAAEVSGSAALRWVPPTQNVDGSPLTDLAGYNIYFGTESRVYGTPLPVTDAGATSTTFTVPLSDENTVELYFAMTALDEDGNESAYSNEVLKMLDIMIIDNLPPSEPGSLEIDLNMTCTMGGQEPGLTCTVTVAP